MALQDGTIACNLKQLTPAHWNAKLTLQVLKVVPTSSPVQGKDRVPTILIARDEECMVQIYVWDFQSIVRANALQIEDVISVQFPEVKFRNTSILGFPGTLDFELHVGSGARSQSAVVEGRSTLLLLPAGNGFEKPLVSSSFSVLTDVCNKECLNNVVTVGAVLLSKGELKSDRSSSYRTIRLWDPSLLSTSQEYVSCTIWGSESALFDKRAVGDFLLLERLKVIHYHGNLQLSTTKHTLIHFNPAIPATTSIKAQFSAFKSPEISSPLPTLKRSASKATDIYSTIRDFPSLTRASKSKTPSKAQKTANVSSSLITDFFHPASAVDPAPPSPEPHFPLPTTQPLGPSATLTPITRRSTEPILISGRFSVIDALMLQDGECCYTIACLSNVFSRTVRGMCVFNCETCQQPGANCVCPTGTSSRCWSYSILAEWKDNQGELVVELNGTQAARLIGFEAALFVDLEEERKRYALDALIGRTFKLKFVKNQGITSIKELTELPFEE